MLLVRNTFTAKPGCASKLAKQIKETAAAVDVAPYRVLTDLAGDMNQVVFEYEVENLAAFEKMFSDTRVSDTFREKMAGYHELWITGNRQILQIL
jgi:predicted phosphoribosyltransferase